MGIHIISLMEKPGSKSTTMGWYVDEEEAFQAVEENRGGIQECIYEYAIIEEVPPGVYAVPTKEAWFKWDAEERKFKQIPKPTEVRGLISWYQ